LKIKVPNGSNDGNWKSPQSNPYIYNENPNKKDSLRMDIINKEKSTSNVWLNRNGNGNANGCDEINRLLKTDNIQPIRNDSYVNANSRQKNIAAYKQQQQQQQQHQKITENDKNTKNKKDFASYEITV
jgi:hypothetical protein